MAGDKDKHRDKDKTHDKDKHRDKDKKHDKDRHREPERERERSASPERAGETEDERRRRRADKKVRKAAKEAEKARTYMGYSNDVNPWNDNRLTEKFTWGKREQRIATAPLPTGGETVARVGERERRAELQAELERVKKAREVRERERDEWEEEKVRIEREREQFAYAEHQRKADEFHLAQAGTRAEIRLQEGRAKPIDMLSFHLLLARKEETVAAARNAVAHARDGERGSDAAIAALEEAAAEEVADTERAELLLSHLSADVVRDPVTLFHGLMAHELKTLLTDLEERVNIDDDNQEFWKAMVTVCQAQVTYQKRRDSERRGKWDGENNDGGDNDGGENDDGGGVASAASQLHEQVAADVSSMLGKKSLGELDTMQKQIKGRLDRHARRQRRLLGPGAARPHGEAGGSGLDLRPGELARAFAIGGQGSSGSESSGSSGSESEPDEALDVDYWAGVLELLQLARAKAVLRDAQRSLIKRQAERMRARGGGTEEGVAEALTRSLREGGEGDEEVADEDELAALGDDGAGGEEGEDVPFDDGRAPAGRYSPVLFDEAQLPDAMKRVVLDADEDLETLELARRKVAVHFGRTKPTVIPEDEEQSGAPAAAEGGAGPSGSGAAKEGGVVAVPVDAQVEAERRKGMEQGEAQFSYEFKLEQHEAWWHEKYRPRKPRYFNRIHTGYEWNKYNQTHYDHDNPPPKMVQGYKFNIFYPDLIDRSTVPAYQLMPDPSGATDTCVIKFHAGPPYEDIAFKVVNMEWELSHRRGFKFRFERGVLQLYFNFKRHRYRR